MCSLINLINEMLFLRPILKDSALSASVKGLEYMNDDPNAVDVLYAKVRLDDGSDR